MTIMIDFPPATLEQLKAEAEATGKDVATFVREAVDARLARRRRTFAEILKPIHDAAQASGMSQEDLDKLAELAVTEARAARQASRQPR